MGSRRAESDVKIIDLYCRISEDYDGDGGYRSVDDQEEDGRDTVADHERDGWRVGEVFKDPALSAWNPKVIRPDWDKLMARLEAGRSHGIWVYDLSRFTRKPIEGERLIALADRGIIVASLDNTYDLGTADGKKQFRDHMNAAAFESDKNSQRSTRGKKKKAQRGGSNASYRGFAAREYLPKPSGWKRGDPRELAPDTVEMAGERSLVRDLARRLLAGGPGNTLDAMTRELNEREIPTVVGNKWSAQALRQMLKRPSLAGLVEYNGKIVEGHRLPGESALDRETWDAVQSLFASRRRGRTPAVYLLSGLWRCGLCGAVLYGRPRTNMKPYSDGEVARQYWCPPRANGVGCGRLSIDYRYAEDVVKRQVIKLLTDPQHATQIARQAAAVQVERDRLLSQKADAEATGRALADRLGRGEITLDRFDAFTAPLDQRIQRYTAELKDLDDPEWTDGENGEDYAAVWKLAESEGDLAKRRRLVKRAFPRLTLLPATSRGPAARRTERFDWYGKSLPQRGDEGRQ